MSRSLHERLIQSFVRRFGRPHGDLQIEEVGDWRRYRVTDPARGLWGEFDTAGWRVRLVRSGDAV